MATCSVIRDQNENIKQVLAPNGAESVLYKDILKYIPNKEEALRVWAKAYTDSFKKSFGNWEASIDANDPSMDDVTRNELQSKRIANTDINGEPKVEFLLENRYQIKRAAELIFEQTPELSNIGTLEDYSRYIDSIFPDSIVKEVVYHGTNNQFEEFEQGHTDPTGFKTDTLGFHFIEEAALDSYRDVYGEVKSVVVDFKNPIYTEYSTEEGSEASRLEYLKQEDIDGFKSQNFDSGIITRPGEQEYVAFDSEQIHILGNKKDIQGFRNFVSFDNQDYYQLETEEDLQEIPSNEEINKQVQGFLENIGVAIQSVDVIKDAQGRPLSAIAKADMLNRIIQVVNDSAGVSTLPEEAAHFFVEMLGPGSALLKDMMNKITSFALYPKVVQDYSKNKAYRNPDGTVNFDKIKKEAIGKAIAQVIIGNDINTENISKSNLLRNWFNKLMDWLKNIFTTQVANDNPFRYAAQQILEGNTSELNEDFESTGDYYQLGVENSLELLDNDQSRLTLDNSIDPITKQKRHIYYYNGNPAKGSVTSVYVDRWLKRIFRSDNRSEAQKNLDLLKAEFGDTIHEQMQDIFKSWTNPDGTIKETQSAVAKSVSADVYSKLNNFVIELLSSYPEGTVIRTEYKVFDKRNNIAGSIDFMAVQPDGTVDILDWKSQEIGKNQTDLKTYKEPMYRIQLGEYRKILEYEYGFKKFGKVRAIPIKTNYVYKDGQIQTLKDIEIGSFDPTLIPEGKEYLLPVTIKNEKTNSEELDDFIKRLNGIYDKINNQRYSKDEIYKKREELGRLRDSLRDLQLRRKVDKMVDLGLLEYKKYSERLKNKTLTGRDVIESEKILSVFSDSGTMLYDMMTDLQRVAKESEDENAIIRYNEVKDKFLSMTANTGRLIKDIQKYRDTIATEMAEENGIVNLLGAEKPIGTLNGLFSSLSKITQKSFRTFYSILRKAQNERDAKFDTDIKNLGETKDAFTKWATKKGLSLEKAMEMILEIRDGKWNGNFLSVYKPEFYKLREKAIKDGNQKWLIDNLDYDEERFNSSLEKQKQFFRELQYKLDEKENEEEVNKKIKEWINSNQVIINNKINFQALNNKNNKFLKPSAEWQTEKWKELNKPENKPLKDAYDLFQSLNRRAESSGMLDQFSPGFIPSIYSSKIDQVTFGNVKDIFSSSGFFEDLQVDSGTRFTPEIDPTDGSIINRIPVYFTKDMGVLQKDGTMDYSKKSRDLFKVYGVWSAHMGNYEAMESIEDNAMILLEAEKNKDSLVTDNFNRIIVENGEAKSAKNNDKNAKILEDFVNFYLYDQVSGKAKDKTFNILGKEYSALKTVSAAMQFFSFKTLALNPVSGTAQFVGGTANALFMAKKGIYFTQKTWAKAMYLSTSDKKAWSAMDYFNTKLENNNTKLIDNLSLSSMNKVFTKDNGYVIQRKSDAAVQQPILLSMMLSHMIDENNNILDINNYVKAKYNYNTNFYNLSKPERDALKKKIDTEVKELQDKKSLYVVGALNASGEFSLPGIEKNSETLGNFRNKVKAIEKSILGNSTKDDINRIRTSMLGMALMQFRSWIPAMMEERFDGLKYNDELGSYTYGKMNLFFSELFSRKFPMMLKSIVTGFGDNAIQAGKDKYQQLKIDAFENGQEFNITEGEFIDLYIGNLKSELLELQVLIGFAISILAVSSAATGDDDENKGMKKYLARALKKYYNEIAFYYLPTEFTQLVKSPLPIVGLAEDFFRFSGAVAKEAAGAVSGSEKLQESAKPAKYFFKMVPVAKEAMLVMASHDDEFRKEWGIKITY